MLVKVIDYRGNPAAVEAGTVIKIRAAEIADEPNTPSLSIMRQVVYSPKGRLPRLSGCSGQKFALLRFMPQTAQ